jgi:tRNA(fMet)-specific endonuclease VapC
MGFLLDTNHCVWLLNASRAALSRKVAALDPGDLAVSVVTLSELHFGAAKSTHRARNAEKIEALVSSVPVLDFDRRKARVAGEIRSALEKRGTPIGPNDLLIAATALDAGLVLVTNNLREFRRVSGLSVEDWSR